MQARFTWDSPALWLIVLLLVPPAVLAAVRDVAPVDSGRWTNEYDEHFRKYTKRYFGPNFDWRWFKAQGIAESALKPSAQSHVGAQGVMQIMPATFEEIKRENPYFSHVEEPQWNIAAGIYYDRMLYKKWSDKVAVAEDRLAFSFGSYNAGLGTILNAWKRAGRVEEPGEQWAKTAQFAPKETRAYVTRIRELMGQE